MPCPQWLMGDAVTIILEKVKDTVHDFHFFCQKPITLPGSMFQTCTCLRLRHGWSPFMRGVTSSRNVCHRAAHAKVTHGQGSGSGT